ncbi:type II toxin-antitoxin system RelE/ParE family toxin [Methylobacterium sp. J-048]|nr:type II toxin-antitoxin system RelE/ParE family toxin [Methylobacterium sp. J-048]
MKQRVARRGQGRSAGFRTILFYRRGETSVFIHMFAKNRKANLTKREQDAFRDYAEQLAQHTEEYFSRLVAERGWRRIDDEQREEDVPQ